MDCSRSDLSMVSAEMTSAGTLWAIRIFTACIMAWLPDDSGNMATFVTEIQCREHAQLERNETGRDAECWPVKRR